MKFCDKHTYIYIHIYSYILSGKDRAISPTKQRNYLQRNLDLESFVSIHLSALSPLERDVEGELAADAIDL